MTFDNVIGQQEVKRRLIEMQEQGKIPHALLFCGPAGTGKMTLAMAFAARLLNTERIEHPDLHFSYPVIRPAGTGAEHKMDSSDFAPQWYEMLKEHDYFNMQQWLTAMDAANQQAQIGRGESTKIMHDMSLKSSQGGYKICIIWMAEYMNSECANELLKLIEEPPPQTIFIFTCQQPEQLLETIKSRTQRIDIPLIDTDSIRQGLIDRQGLSDEDATRTARMARGSWTTALDLLKADNENDEFLDMFILLMRKAYQRDIKELTKWSERIEPYGREKQKRMLTYFLRLVRENFMYNFQRPELCYMSKKEEQFSSRFARFINEANVIPISQLLQRAIRDITQNANSKMVFYHLALNIIVLLIKK